MRLNRLVACSACVAAVTVLCSCTSSPSSSSASSASSKTSGCPYTSDSVVAGRQPLVEASAPQSKAGHVVSPGRRQSLPCDTTLTVTRSGTAEAQFGPKQQCQLQPFEQQPASFISRDPAGDLLMLIAGYLRCSVNVPVSSPPDTVPCPYGEVVAKRAQFFEICLPDPDFKVAVFSGSARVIDPKGHSYPLQAGDALYLDSTVGVYKEETSYIFSTEDKRVFGLQAPEVGLGAG